MFRSPQTINLSQSLREFTYRLLQKAPKRTLYSLNWDRRAARQQNSLFVTVRKCIAGVRHVPLVQPQQAMGAAAAAAPSTTCQVESRTA
jgi:hypothetical protein